MDAMCHKPSWIICAQTAGFDSGAALNQNPDEANAVRGGHYLPECDRA
jgi:hypothetical protein